MKSLWWPYKSESHDSDTTIQNCFWRGVLVCDVACDRCGSEVKVWPMRRRGEESELNNMDDDSRDCARLLIQQQQVGKSVFSPVRWPLWKSAEGSHFEVFWKGSSVKFTRWQDQPPSCQLCWSPRVLSPQLRKKTSLPSRWPVEVVHLRSRGYRQRGLRDRASEGLRIFERVSRGQHRELQPGQWLIIWRRCDTAPLGIIYLRFVCVARVAR